MTKKVQILLTLLIPLFNLVYIRAEIPDITSLDSRTSLIIDLNKGWMMRIGLDGSGLIGYGESAFDTTTFPKNTIDRKSINMLFNTFSETNIDASDIQVAILTSAHDKYPHFFIKDKAFLGTLFKLGISKGSPLNPEEFKTILHARPPWDIFSTVDTSTKH